MGSVFDDGLPGLPLPPLPRTFGGKRDDYYLPRP